MKKKMRKSTRMDRRCGKYIISTYLGQGDIQIDSNQNILSFQIGTFGQTFDIEFLQAKGGCVKESFARRSSKRSSKGRGQKHVSECGSTDVRCWTLEMKSVSSAIGEMDYSMGSSCEHQ